jgi:dihydroorotate dehydrogenase (NAD+) catalytic subunit
MTFASNDSPQFAIRNPQLEVEIAGVRFNNPVWTASGTCGYGLDMAELIDLNKLGGICTKGLSAKPMRGNAPWRIVETHGGMLNAIGLQNIGARAFVTDKLPELRRYDTRVIPNVFGYTIDEYIEAIQILEDGEGIHAYELNISCPNVKAGGESFANDSRQAAAVTEAVKKAASSSGDRQNVAERDRCCRSRACSRISRSRCLVVD